MRRFYPDFLLLFEQKGRELGKTPHRPCSRRCPQCEASLWDRARSLTIRSPVISIHRPPCLPLPEIVPFKESKADGHEAHPYDNSFIAVPEFGLQV